MKARNIAPASSAQVQPLIERSNKAKLRIVDFDLEALFVCKRVRNRVLKELRSAESRIHSYGVCQRVGENSLQQHLLLALPVPINQRHRLQVVLNCNCIQFYYITQ